MFNELESKLVVILAQEPIEWQAVDSLFLLSALARKYRLDRDRYTINLDKLFREKPEYRPILANVALSAWQQGHYSYVEELLYCTQKPLFLEDEALSEETKGLVTAESFRGDIATDYGSETLDSRQYEKSMAMLKQLLGVQHFKTLKNNKNETPLMEAIKNNDYKKIQVLIELGVDVNQPAFVSSYEKAQRFMNRGAEGTPDYIITPLVMVIMHGYRRPRDRRPQFLEFLKILLQAGADVMSKTHAGKTVLEESLDRRIVSLLNHRTESFDVQRYTSGVANYKCIALLTQYGADIECHDNDAQRTPLLRAAFADDLNLVQLFVNAGANLDAKDKDDKGIRDCGHPLIVQYINDLSENELAKNKENQAARQAGLQQKKEALQKSDETQEEQMALPQKLDTVSSDAGPSQYAMASSSSASQVENNGEIPPVLEALMLAIITRASADASQDLGCMASCNRNMFSYKEALEFSFMHFMADDNRQNKWQQFVVKNIGDRYLFEFLNWISVAREDNTCPVVAVLKQEDMAVLHGKFSEYNILLFLIEFQKHLIRFFTEGDCMYLLLETDLCTNKVFPYILTADYPEEAVKDIVNIFPEDSRGFVASVLFSKLLSDVYPASVAVNTPSLQEALKALKVRQALLACANFGADLNRDVMIPQAPTAASSSHAEVPRVATTALALASEHHDLDLLKALLTHPRMSERLPEGFSLWPLLRERQRLRSQPWSRLTHFVSTEKDYHLTQIKLLCEKYSVLATEPLDDEEKTRPREWALRCGDNLLVEYFDEVMRVEIRTPVREDSGIVDDAPLDQVASSSAPATAAGATHDGKTNSAEDLTALGFLAAPTAPLVDQSSSGVAEKRSMDLS